MRISDWSSDVCSSDLWVVRRSFGKISLSTQRTEHLVGGNVVKAEHVALCSIQPLIISQRLLKHIEGAHDIGLDERARAIDGTVDMTLRRQMRNNVRLEIRQQESDRSEERSAGKECDSTGSTRG